ncbi:damage-control phosphatase ARMT1 family protein [Streptomyces sp. ME01-24h]|nr:damage-control phosphatase ARMT1 family protein [Streptomyces sp. ME19-03-3]MDX3356538.1 damage-control phosphatase ARMT1 family protein [Streptomyces sp. ME01-24h]
MGAHREGPFGPAQAPRITCDEPGSFAWGVFQQRHPVLVRRILDAVPYGPRRRRGFAALLAESRTGTVAELPGEAPDRAAWEEWGQGRFGRPWPELPFLWAESYFYRRLLDPAGYLAAGPWHGVDLFAPFKDAELDGPGFAADLAALDGLRGLAPADREDALLTAAVWGNQADLGFTMVAEAAGGGAAGALVADESQRLWSLLNGGTVVVVTDNSAREVLADLALVDDLLTSGRAREVHLLVKPRPYYVSDATTQDVLSCLRRMTAAPGEAARIGGRLVAALREGRLDLTAHPFACAPLGYRDMPDDLRERFAAGQLTLMKGDLNYRRLVDDRLWPATVPFAEVTDYFPGPVAALRTLKSDTVTGLAPETVARLDAAGDAWRTSGTHALIQVAVPG